MTSRHVIISIRTHIREDQLLTRKQYTTRTKQKNISPYGAHGVGQRHWEIRFVSGKKSFPLRETNGHFVLRCLYEEWKIREQRNRKKAGTKKSFIRPSWYREMSFAWSLNFTRPVNFRYCRYIEEHVARNRPRAFNVEKIQLNNNINRILMSRIIYCDCIESLEIKEDKHVPFILTGIIESLGTI